MVLIAPLVGAAVFLSGFAAALPTSYGSSSSGSSYGSSDYGSSDSSGSGYSSDSSSSYGSSGSDSSGYDSSYGSSDSSYGGSSNYNSGDSSYGDNTYTSSTMMMEDSSTMMMDTETIDSTSTATGYNSYQTYSYGSGSSYWGGSGYEDCVNQCIAQYGNSMGGEYQATQTAAVGGYGGGGSGATHTVIVAPTKGVFRMMPFATNASVGDTIEFHWGADQHTVTKSSALTPCNKSNEAPVFASGEQNASFVFREMVNDTNPIFYYCGTPTHCEKGMFGVINPATTVPGAPSSLAAMMSTLAANDSTLSAYAAYTANNTAGNEVMNGWNMNMDLSAIPDWARSLAVENTLFTQSTIGKNSWMMTDTGLDLSAVGTKALDLPLDTSMFNGASSGSAAASVSAAPGPVGADATSAGADATSASASASASSSSSSNTSGANSVASPRFLVAAVVVVATIFAL